MKNSLISGTTFTSLAHNCPVFLIKSFFIDCLIPALCLRCNAAQRAAEDKKHPPGGSRYETGERGSGTRFLFYLDDVIFSRPCLAAFIAFHMAWVCSL